MKRCWIGLTMAVAATLLLAPIARADTSNILEPQHDPPTAADGWLAGPCTTDVPTCSQQTPGQFYTTAGGHPPRGFVQFIVRHQVLSNGKTLPLEPIPPRVAKNLVVDLPPGLSVNLRRRRSAASRIPYHHRWTHDADLPP